MTNGENVVFLHGADMAPETVRATFPGGHFIARARVDAGSLPIPAPSGAAPAEIWGILVSVPDDTAPSSAPSVTATADDGRAFAARPVTGPDALADPTATVAAARYWELPPTYVAALASRIPVQ